MSSAPPRFSIAHPPDVSRRAQVEGTELHHMRAVLRLTIGAHISLLDPAGREHHGTIERYERERAIVRVESSPPRALSQYRTRIILAAAIVKGPHMDFMVEKAAELGASELWPLACARGVVQSPGAERLKRWRRLALGAAKQSQSAAAMEIQAPISFDEMIREVPLKTLAVVCAQGGRPLGELVRRVHPRAILIAVGPEGDFDDDERAKAANAGFVAAGLGPNRLRSETAALAAVSIAAELLHDGQRSGEDGETE